MKQSLEDEIQSELERIRSRVQVAILNRFQGKLKMKVRPRVIRKMKSTVLKVLMSEKKNGRL